MCGTSERLQSCHVMENRAGPPAKLAPGSRKRPNRRIACRPNLNFFWRVGKRPRLGHLNTEAHHRVFPDAFFVIRMGALQRWLSPRPNLNVTAGDTSNGTRSSGTEHGLGSPTRAAKASAMLLAEEQQQRPFCSSSTNVTAARGRHSPSIALTLPPPASAPSPATPLEAWLSPISDRVNDLSNRLAPFFGFGAADVSAARTFNSEALSAIAEEDVASYSGSARAVAVSGSQQARQEITFHRRSPVGEGGRRLSRAGERPPIAGPVASPPHRFPTPIHHEMQIGHR